MKQASLMQAVAVSICRSTTHITFVGRPRHARQREEIPLGLSTPQAHTAQLHTPQLGLGPVYCCLTINPGLWGL